MVKGDLKGLHKLFIGDYDGSLSSLHYAPQRFFSHARAAQDIAKTFPEMLLYLMQLTRSSSREQAIWAQNLLSLGDGMKTWLLFAVIADVLDILRRCNIKMQRGRLHLQDVERLLAQTHSELEDYFGEDGIVNKSLNLLVARRNTEIAPASQVESVCNLVQIVRVRWHGETRTVGRYEAEGGNVHDMLVQPTVKRDVARCAAELADIVQDDLRQRFSSVGISRYFYILRYGYREPGADDESDRAVQYRLQPAAKALAEHFAMDFGALLRELRILQTARIVYERRELGSEALGVHAHWQPLLQQHKVELPLACRCLRGMLVLQFQNGAAERHIKVVGDVQSAASQNLGWDSLDSRCRVVHGWLLGEGILGRCMVEVGRGWGAMARRRFVHQMR